MLKSVKNFFDCAHLLGASAILLLKIANLKSPREYSMDVVHVQFNMYLGIFVLDGEWRKFFS